MTVTDAQKFIVEYVYYKDPNGELYPLFGGNRVLMGWEGFGAPPINYLSDKGPNQHGRTIRDFRYQERQISLELLIEDCRRPDWWQNEYDLINALRPNRSSTNAKSYLLVINQDYTEREIEARLSRGPGGNWDGLGVLQPSDLRERLTFVSGDPFWRDPAQITAAFTLNPAGACLPTCLPLCLGGTGLINTTNTITYTGTWEGDQLEIILTGPMVAPIIRNDATGKEIAMNYTIANGEAVTINITPTITTVTSNTGGNLIGTVQDIADLNDFRLVTAGNLTSTGAQNITVLASGGESPQTSVLFKYYTRDITVFNGG